MLEVLCRYMPRMTARGVLYRELRDAGLVNRSVTSLEVPALSMRVARVSRLIVGPTQHHALKRDLDSLWRRVSVPNESLAIFAHSDIVTARARARSLSLSVGARSITAQHAATVVSELARNIVLYTRGGKLELGVREPPRRIVIVATDDGPGIDNLPEIMSGTYRSKTGLGRGLLGTRQIAHHFEIDSRPGHTRIAVELLL